MRHGDPPIHPPPPPINCAIVRSMHVHIDNASERVIGVIQRLRSKKMSRDGEIVCGISLTSGQLIIELFPD